MRKLLPLLAVLVGIAVCVSAQTQTISGRVVDKSGSPIPNASILIKGTKSATVADADGNFSMKAGPGTMLTVSAVSYKPFNIRAQGTSMIITLESGDNLMNEVIVTAGGIKSKRKEIGTANTVIKSEQLIAGKSNSIAGGLQGKVAGLQISGTSGGVNPSFRLTLRGQRSLTGNNQALVVLDNVIVPNDILANLNPEDVEELVVLNGAGAAALYGSQASNGAVVITTKKGKKGVTEVSFSNTTMFQTLAYFPKLQKKFGPGGTAYGSDVNGRPLFSYLENQSYGPEFDGSKQPLGPALEDGSQDSSIYAYNPGHLKFWLTGVTNQSDFSLQNGDEKSTFFLSGQYATTKGTTPGDKFNKTSVRINGTRRLGNSIAATYSAAYIQNRYDITSSTGSMYGNLLNMPSNVDITKYKDWRTNKFANPNGFYNPWYQNPYFTADNNRTNSRNDYFTANVEVRFTPATGLDLIARQGVVTRNYSGKSTVGAFNYTDFAKHTDASSKTDIPASVADYSSYTTELLSDAFGQYNIKKGVFDLKVIAGAQWRQDQSKSVAVSANALAVPNLFNASNGVGTPGAGESNYKARQIGAYGDIRIGFKDYLFLHATGRNDWVSILAPENRSFFYPSVDLSFIATDAIPLLMEKTPVTYLKFRAGLSKVGQVNLGNSFTFGAYSLLPTFNQASGYPYGSMAGYTVGNVLVSNNLKPEITKGYELGFDLNMFNDRFQSTVTWYDTKTDDQTVTTNVSNSTGFTNLLTNTGQTQSSGLEVTAHVTPYRSKDLEVTVGGNYTYLDNKVNFISADLPKLSLSSSGSATSYAIAGQAFPVIMGFDYNRDPQGHVIVDGITGLPTKSDTISILGNGQPKNRLGLDGSIRFKNFRFSFLFEYRGGYEVFNGIGTELDWSGTGYRTGIYNRQRFVFPNSVIADPANPDKYMPNTNISVKNGNGNNGFWTDGINRDVTSNYVTSGKFWKLREVALAYDLPVSLLNKTKYIKSVTISAQGRNLLMWLSKDNYYTDPEFSAGGTDNNGIGLNSIDQAPPSRYYGGTITVKF
jgi:TonB-linked SusC/RagA family outer membrane protein